MGGLKLGWASQGGIKWRIRWLLIECGCGIARRGKCGRSGAPEADAKESGV